MCFGSCCRKKRRENNRVYPASETTTPESTRPIQPIQPITTQPKATAQPSSAPSLSSSSQPRAWQPSQPVYGTQTGILKEKKTVLESIPGRKSVTETVIEDRRTTVTTKQLNDSARSRMASSHSGSSGKQVCDAGGSPEKEAWEQGRARSDYDPSSRGVSSYSKKVCDEGRSICEQGGAKSISEQGARSVCEQGARGVYEQGTRSVCEQGARGVYEQGTRSVCEQGIGSYGLSTNSATSRKATIDSKSDSRSNEPYTLTTKTSVCDVREITKSSENIHRAMSKGSNIIDIGDFDSKRPSRKISAMQAGACPGRGQDPRILDSAQTCPQAQSNFKSFTDCQKLQVADD